MAEEPNTDFTYSLVQRLLQEARYDQAITSLTQRIEAQPEDRMARLLLLLTNVSQFGTGPFSREIEALRLLADLSSNERHIVRKIFLVCFQHAERDGQTLQKIVYQRLIRRLMLNQPLDLSISDAREIEQSEQLPGTSATPVALTWTATSADEAGPEPLPVAPRRIDRWDEYALIGAGALIVIVLLGVYVMTGRRTPLAQNSAQLLSLVSENSETPMAADRTRPAVMLASTFAAEPTRRMLLDQLEGLKAAYARWTDSDPTTRGTVSLRLKVDPAGNVAEVEEVVSRLSEHRFVDVVVNEAKLWKLPHGSATAAEISVPLIFDPRSSVPPAQKTALRKPVDPVPPRKELAAAHTQFAREETKPEAAGPSPTLAQNELTLESHTRGLLGPTSDNESAAGPKVDALRANLTVKRDRNAAPLPHVETVITEIARAAPLKSEPRFAAEAIEKVGLGTRVTVLQKERDWIKVKVQSSGNIGYMRKEYLNAFSSFR
ncbi:MAG TPA: SH3 domain-containing protein [Candidatus Binatia bacterium]